MEILKRTFDSSWLPLVGLHEIPGKFDHKIDNLTKSFHGKVKFFKGIPKSQPSVLE